jgi:hypothetical protein
MLGELIVREVLCKAAVLTVSRREQSEKMPGQLSLELNSDSKTLPAPIEVTETSPNPKPEEK